MYYIYTVTQNLHDTLYKYKYELIVYVIYQKVYLIDYKFNRNLTHCNGAQPCLKNRDALLSYTR